MLSMNSAGIFLKFLFDRLYYILKKLTANYSLIAHSCTCGESPKFNWFSEKKEMFPYDVFEEGFLSPNRIISSNKIGSHSTLNHCCR